ncbi:YaeQ family protein [Pollutimonas harenae]|uniref:YaeQ family protein n=1 Tax=Pollutimonas harenae TaxID=657015 RepID=A0A853H6I2_9BURK|nr:YaeQ family protein [Pollutimonas harenae]NYT86123.1 YaeQ family protein [Pollutimonas harenae]TEA71164.1 YaeQ family protein [Pollutimonas harenae]
MALRATIFKLELHVADMDRNYYGSHVLTLARHPSETDERMMLRVLAFAMYASEDLSFTRGLSTTDEPSLWQKDLTGFVLNWIELGHPDERRLLQAGGKSDQVVVFCYGGHASQVWWQGVQASVARMRKLDVLSVEPTAVQALASLSQRNMTLHVTIQEGVALVASDNDSVSVEVERWR